MIQLSDEPLRWTIPVAVTAARVFHKAEKDVTEHEIAEVKRVLLYMLRSDPRDMPQA